VFHLLDVALQRLTTDSDADPFQSISGYVTDLLTSARRIAVAYVIVVIACRSLNAAVSFAFARWRQMPLPSPPSSTCHLQSPAIRDRDSIDDLLVSQPVRSPSSAVDVDTVQFTPVKEQLEPEMMPTNQQQTLRVRFASTIQVSVNDTAAAATVAGVVQAGCSTLPFVAGRRIPVESKV